MYICVCAYAYVRVRLHIFITLSLSLWPLCVSCSCCVYAYGGRTMARSNAPDTTWQTKTYLTIERTRNTQLFRLSLFCNQCDSTLASAYRAAKTKAERERHKQCVNKNSE